MYSYNKIFLPQICCIDQGKLSGVSQENIVENLILAVRSVFNARVCTIAHETTLQVFPSVFHFPAEFSFGIPGVDADAGGGDLPPALPHRLHQHHLPCQELLDRRQAKEEKKD